MSSDLWELSLNRDSFPDLDECWKLIEPELGIDTDRAEGSNVISKYYRIRWPGNGSFLIGGGGFRNFNPGKPLEPFDLGGVFFKAPQKVQPKSYWNSMGFWLIRESELNQWQFWIGVPSWFPILLTGALPVRWWILHQQRKT
ncbi:MAG: hypothetical protein U7123_13625 [Potamolinea sp.]